MTNEEYLRVKSDGVKDILKWMQTKVKEGGYFTLPDAIIGIDKYRKKLIHQADEANWDY